ncbi:MAG: protein kinase domain-containing protein, partial [Acidobacteriota bacterium]
MTACPSDEQLVRMVEGALADESLAHLEQHVAGCERCAALVGELGAVGRGEQPRSVGRYQLDRRIAAGGMGEVWAAWDPQLERDVAIKLVKPERADDSTERERLLREARALAKLTHPNVLAVHDVGEQDGEVFLATELVPGDTLASRGGASCDWRALARLYVQAARGLAAAHAVGLVHRDVKPANLLVGADGRVRVGDFGLAVKETRESGPIDPAGLTVRSDARTARDPQVTAPGAIAGTPAYMAPEQRLGVPPDARCDQFALCVALVEGSCGRRPAAAIEPAQLIAFVSERRAREPELDAMCTLLSRGLAFEPDERFESMTALADAMEDVVGKPSVGAVAVAASTNPPPMQ